MISRQIVLASTSPFRRALLERFGFPFETAAPSVDETRLPDESPEQTALRLSEKKARAVVSAYPQALIVGSDQIACFGEEIFGKPGTHENATAQLRKMRGQTVCFHTGLCLYDASKNTARLRNIPTLVTFRALNDEEIESYLRKEQPYNCAGSAKSEALGIALLSKIESADPTALIGLPLIALSEFLREAGINPLLGAL
ncbi:MAG: Maf family nucleotide pyrophosphatase [Candidatus Accumulibacter sp.]|nr:Maf family nucleotide pyrophosphatase [Accumulibacter sp.]